MNDELAELDATAQAELVRRGEATPAELVDAAIARVERLDPELNAVIHPLFEKARDAAHSPALPHGPFRGVPFLVKDAVCHTAGDPFHCGMRALKQAGWTESADTVLAERFRAAGFVFVGKTNTPELAYSITTEPLAYGATRNPWNPAHSTGGSSGGSAAAVAAGLVPVAHANDMGGSIRVPASCCGLVGLKPTRARSSLAPDFGEYWCMLTHEHVLTRSVRDSARVLDAIRGPAPGDPYTAPAPARPFAEEVGAPVGSLRIGLRLLAPGGAEVDPECRAAVVETGRLLESLGHRVEETSPPALDDTQDLFGVFKVFSVAIARDVERFGAKLGRSISLDELEPTNQFAAETGRGVSATALLEAIEKLQRWARRCCAWWERGFDVLVTPTLAQLPPPLGFLASTATPPEEVFARWGAFTPFTLFFNVTGQPALSLPLHWSASGLPIGVQFAAASAREDVLLRLAAQLEEARPWRQRRPGLHS